MERSIAFAPEIADRLRREAISGAVAGREACGFMLGEVRQGHVVALDLARVRNRARAAREFAICAHDRATVAAGCRAGGLAVVAVYHTHLGGSARPSATDIAAVQHSDVPWVIAARAVAGDEVEIAAFAPGTARLLEVVTSRDHRLR